MNGVEPSRRSNLELSELYKGSPHARAIDHIENHYGGPEDQPRGRVDETTLLH